MLVRIKPGLVQFWLASTPMANFFLSSAASNTPRPEAPAAAKITAAPPSCCDTASSLPLGRVFPAAGEDHVCAAVILRHGKFFAFGRIVPRFAGHAYVVGQDRNPGIHFLCS